MRAHLTATFLIALAGAASAQGVRTVVPEQAEPAVPPASVPPIVGEGEVAADGSGQPLRPSDFAETALSSPSHTAATSDIGPATGIGGPGLIRPDITREGFAAVDIATMDLTQLLGVRVYDVNDERIGEIDRWIGGEGGALPAGAVVDVGGFLGLGERPVAIDLGAMTVMADADGDDLRIYVDATEAQLDGLPEWID